jgi:hypothetical protein
MQLQTKRLRLRFTAIPGDSSLALLAPAGFAAAFSAGARDGVSTALEGV